MSKVFSVLMILHDFYPPAGRKLCASLQLEGFIAEILTRDWHKLRFGKISRDQISVCFTENTARIPRTDEEMATTMGSGDYGWMKVIDVMSKIR